MRIGEGEESSRASSASAFHSFTTEHATRFQGGAADIRNYDWKNPTADSWVPCHYFIDMPITPRPQPNWAVYKDICNKRVSLDKIWFVPPALAIESGTSVGRQRSLHLTMDREIFDDLLETEPHWPDFLAQAQAPVLDMQSEALLRNIAQEIQRPTFASQILLECYTRAFAVTVARNVQLLRPKIDKGHKGGLSPWRMRRINEWIEADLPPPSLADLAEYCGLSVRHLCRAYKTQTGQNLADYLRDKMVKRAQRKIILNDMPIAEIAALSGFKSPASFSYAFKQATGYSPTQFKNSNIADQDIRLIL